MPTPKTAMWRIHSPIVATTWGAAATGATYWDDPSELGTWQEMPIPSYRYGLDSAGLGELTVTLPRRLGLTDANGDFISDPDLAMHNLLEVHVFDGADDDGTLVYRGRLEEYEIGMEPGHEGVDLTFVPLSSALADTFIVGPVSFTATDPGDMMRWFLENEYLPGFAWDYTAGETVGTTYDRTFERQTMLQIFTDILRLAGADYHFTVKRDQVIRFRRTPATANHALTLGVHVSEADYTRSGRRQITRVTLYYTGGSVTRLAAEFDPANPRDHVVIDEKITDAVVARAVADSTLNRLNDLELRGTVTVLDSAGPDAADGKGYDIESILPGDTVSIRNPLHLDQPPTWGAAATGTTIWDGEPASIQNDVLLVANVDYRFDRAVLELADRQPSPVIEQDDLRDRILRHLTEAT